MAPDQEESDRLLAALKNDDIPKNKIAYLAVSEHESNSSLNSNPLVY